MDSDLEPIYLRITQAVHPEDVFGCEDIVLPIDTLLAYLEEEYEQLKPVVVAESYSSLEDIDAAKEASSILEAMYAEAQRRIRAMTYGILGFGDSRPVSASRFFEVANKKYYVERKLNESSTSALFQGFLEDDGASLGEVVLKLSASASENPRILRELEVLERLHSESVPQWRHFPYVLDRFQAGTRLGLVQRKMYAFSLSEVRKHPEHHKGVEQKHVAWMLDRIFSALGYVHQVGVVHGNLSPSHVLIQPPSHNVFIAGGWGSAVLDPALSGERVLQPSEVFSAPELHEDGRIGPWSDVYSVGKLAIWLFGGDPVTNSIPSVVEVPFRDFVLDMVEERIARRPADAWELHQVWCEVKDSLWPRKFLHFNML